MNGVIGGVNGFEHYKSPSQCFLDADTAFAFWHLVLPLALGAIITLFVMLAVSCSAPPSLTRVFDIDDNASISCELDFGCVLCRPCGVGMF